MKLKGVITGDIVQSSKIEPTRRQLLIDCIQKIADDFFKPDFEYKYLKFHEIDTWPTFTENKIDSCYDRKGEILIPS